MCFLKVAAAGLHLYSAHTPQHEFVNVTPGGYVRNECGTQLGVMRNSEDRLGAYLMQTLEGKRFFAGAGVAVGYEGRAVTPMAIAGVKIGQFRLGYIPRVKSYNSHVLHVSWEITF